MKKTAQDMKAECNKDMESLKKKNQTEETKTHINQKVKLKAIQQTGASGGQNFRAH
jgi:hypothetical protein